MSEQLLQAAQVGSGPQQMRGKAVSQGMRSCAGRQAQRQPGASHGLLDHALRKNPAALPAKYRIASLRGPRALGEIVPNRSPHDRQQRHRALLAALAGHDQHLAQGQIGPG